MMNMQKRPLVVGLKYLKKVVFGMTLFLSIVEVIK